MAKQKKDTRKSSVLPVPLVGIFKPGKTNMRYEGYQLLYWTKETQERLNEYVKHFLKHK